MWEVDEREKQNDDAFWRAPLSYVFMTVRLILSLIIFNFISLTQTLCANNLIDVAKICKIFGGETHTILLE